MITSLSANKPSAESKLGADRAANHAATIRSDSKDEVASYYAALLRLAEAQQSSAGLANYVLGVTSCGRGQGVTTVAVNLAVVAARNSTRRVLLVDANSQNPSVGKYLKLRTHAEIDVLNGSAWLRETLQDTSIPGMSVLTVGSGTKKLGSDFSVADVSALLDELRTEFELIVFDLPQADELSECYAFAEMLDGLFLVVEAGRVDVAVARRVKQRLDHCQANLLGAIYNKHS